MSVWDDIQKFATTKYGPLPAWGWGVIGAGGIWAWRLATGTVTESVEETPGLESYEEQALSYALGGGIAVGPPPPPVPIGSPLSISTPNFDIEGVGPDVMSIIGQYWDRQASAPPPAPPPAPPVQAPPTELPEPELAPPPPSMAEQLLAAGLDRPGAREYVRDGQTLPYVPATGPYVAPHRAMVPTPEGMQLLDAKFILDNPDIFQPSDVARAKTIMGV